MIRCCILHAWLGAACLYHMVNGLCIVNGLQTPCTDSSAVLLGAKKRLIIMRLYTLRFSLFTCTPQDNASPSNNIDRTISFLASVPPSSFINMERYNLMVYVQPAAIDTFKVSLCRYKVSERECPSINDINRSPSPSPAPPPRLSPPPRKQINLVFVSVHG